MIFSIAVSMKYSHSTQNDLMITIPTSFFIRFQFFPSLTINDSTSIPSILCSGFTSGVFLRFQQFLRERLCTHLPSLHQVNHIPHLGPPPDISLHSQSYTANAHSRRRVRDHLSHHKRRLGEVRHDILPADDRRFGSASMTDYSTTAPLLYLKSRYAHAGTMKTSKPMFMTENTSNP